MLIVACCILAILVPILPTSWLHGLSDREPIVLPAQVVRVEGLVVIYPPQVIYP